MAYLAKTGLTYPVGQRNIGYAQTGQHAKITKWREVAAGEVVDDVPECSVAWLLACGAIEPVDGE